MTLLRHIPNIITSLRIVGTGALLLTRPLSHSFYLLYFFTGLTDVLDGFIARRMHISSDFGSKLDSVADMLFYAVMLCAVFPVLWDRLPLAIWYVFALILVIRACSYSTAAIKYHRFSSTHTWLNKLTGASAFSIPFVLLLPCDTVLCWCICIISGMASTEELVIHLISKDYDPNVKSILDINGGRFSSRLLHLMGRDGDKA